MLGVQGIDVNQANEHGKTPLDRASCSGYTEVVKLLLAAPRIDVNQANEHGKTPLVLASDWGLSESVKLLVVVVLGIRVSLKDKEGNSAMDVARNSVVAFVLEEVVAVKRTFGALLLTFAHRGISRNLAALLAMHGLPGEEAKAMARRMRATWPADP